MSQRLRAVGDDEKVTPAAPLTVAQAAKAGDQKKLLVAMRDRIADAVSRADCAPRDLASLTKRLQDIVHDIAVIDAIAEEEAQQAKQRQSSRVDTDRNSYDASAI